MSILDRDPVDQMPDPAVMAAQRLIRMTKHTFDQMVNSFNELARIFWANQMGATPEEIAVELGNNAQEVFYLHARLGELIALLKPEAIQEGASVVGYFQLNADGSVTILPPPPVYPEVSQSDLTLPDLKES